MPMTERLADCADDNLHMRRVGLAHELHESREVASRHSCREVEPPRPCRAVRALGEELVHEVRLPGAWALLHQGLYPSG